MGVELGMTIGRGLVGAMALASACVVWTMPAAARAEVPLVPLAEETLLERQSRYRLLRDNRLAQDRAALLQAIAHSLRYLNTPSAATAYANYPVPDFSLDRTRRSLLRFQELLQTMPTQADLEAAIAREFVLYQSVGHDGEGTVSFTGYFEPVYPASPVPTAEFRYPLYREPPDLDTWDLPHPTRAELEGADGLQGSQGRLRGLELVWLRDRLDAFLIQVQGSARLELVSGGVMTVGYAGHTDYPYVSLGRELINDGRLPAEGLTLPAVLDFFAQNPAELDVYIPRNNRFVFFRETAGQPPTGSLSVPVTPERSIATDKTLMPPGALALIHTELPYPDRTGQLHPHRVSRFVLDQDTGGAIQGAGRVDIFLGTGERAGDRAGLVNTPGQLYYLLLRE